MALSASDLSRLGPEAQKQVLQKLTAAQRAQSAGKYHAEKDSRGALKFDSKAEARRYDELMALLKAGKIKNLRLQQQFTLVEGYVTPEGVRVRPMKYVADFVYEVQRCKPGMGDPLDGIYWDRIVEDVKGVRTAAYKMKAKMMLDKYGIVIREVEA